MTRLRLPRGIVMLLAAAFWLALWWLVVVAFGISRDFLPTPLEVLEKIGSLTIHPIGAGTIWVHAGWSILRFLSGFAPSF